MGFEPLTVASETTMYVYNFPARKGMGEVGAAGSPPVMADVLRKDGVRRRKLLATPRKIWTMTHIKQLPMAAR